MRPRIKVDFEKITGEMVWRHIPIDLEQNADYANLFHHGMLVVLFAEDDLEAEGKLEFDEKTKRWYGVPDWRTVYYHVLARVPHDPNKKDELPRIRADFNTIMTDPRQRVWIPEQEGLVPEMRVLFVDDFEVEGVVIYDDKHQSWYGLPDWSTLHYYDEDNQASDNSKV